MNKSFFVWLLLLLCSFSVGSQNYRSVRNESVQRGEHIEYRVHYGFLEVGVANVDVHQQAFVLNNRACYRVDVVGKTTSLVGAVVPVNDTWRSYVDTVAFVSHRFYRDISEGNYRRQEMSDYNPSNNTGTLKFEQYNAKEPNKRERGSKSFKTPSYVQDMVSGAYYLRTVDFASLQPGSIITVPGVLEDATYNMQIKYVGRETVKTKIGKIAAFKCVPVLPKTDMFEGDSSIRFWLSDDKNRVPVRVEADMTVGKVVLEIKGHRGLRNQLNTK